MNSQTFTRAVKCTKLSVSIFFLFSSVAYSDWKIDFSRRRANLKNASQNQQMSETLPLVDAYSLSKPVAQPVALTADSVTTHNLNVRPSQEIVILHTEQGFVPSAVYVRKGEAYRIVVVNVNEKMRNVSFIMDSFSEFHSTFFGHVKSFVVQPRQEGVFTFVSPESSAQGRFVVQPQPNNDRRPAAAGE